MRILDEERDVSLNRATIYLTMSEASELRDSLDALIKDHVERHEHVPSDDYRKELTICIYDVDNLKFFNERSKQLIIQDS
jgi:GGDEF domain-containing protein